MFLIKYFEKKMNLITFFLLLFSFNIFIIMIYMNYNFLYAISMSLITIIIYQFLLSINKVGEEHLLIKDGNINFHEVIKYYNLKKLVLEMKKRGLRLDEIAFCIKKDNELIVMKNKDINSYPVSLIVDGNLLEENLKLVNKDKKWLQEELLKKNLLIKKVNFAYYKQDKVYFVI